MTDDNVIRLTQLSDKTMVREEDMPKAGSHEWTRHILRNIFNAYQSPEQIVEAAIAAQDEASLDRIFKLLVGNLIDLLFTPVEEYHCRGKEVLGEHPERAPGNEDFSIRVIGDILIFFEKDLDYVKKFVEELTVGQVMTFFVEIEKTIGKVLKEGLDNE